MVEDNRSSRRRGRPLHAVLTQQKIADAAMGLIRQRGYRGLTMSSVAGKLGVSTSALYNHVKSKRDVMILVQDKVNMEIDCSAFETEAWDIALETWARSYREVYSRHIPLIPVMTVMPVTDSPHTLFMYEKVVAGLTRGGWPESLVVNVIVAVESLVFGSAYDSTAPGDIFDPGDLRNLAPAFSAAVDHRQKATPGDRAAAESRAGADAAFNMGLESMIMGFRSMLRSTPTPAAT